jgi:hypothetical protein
MSRFQFYSYHDTTDQTSGDDRFVGIDSTHDMPAVAPGMLSIGENTRVRTGKCKQRSGTVMPGDFNPIAGFGNYLVGSGVFRDPNGKEILMVAPANAGYTWALSDGYDPVQILYDITATANNGPGGGINGVQFVQAFDKLLLLRRPIVVSGANPQGEILVWDGNNGSRWLPLALSANGRTIVPGAFNGEPFQDRIIYYKGNQPAIIGRDQWQMSDVADYTSYNDVFQAFRTNPGEADFITRILSYFHGSVVIFKNQSIHMAELIPFTYPIQVQQRILSRTIGGVGNRMPVMVGGDVLFASMPNGFYSLSTVLQEQINALPAPISEPIQNVVNQINWPVVIQMGVGAAVDNYAFFAVALGPGATRLNAILVYDTQRRQWESAPDNFADQNFAFNAMHLTNWGNVQRLFVVDYQNADIYVMYQGITDQLGSGEWQVPFKMQTRGYTGGDPLGVKRFGRATIGLTTYDPEITVTAVTDGFNEEKNLTPIPLTKNRLRFYQFEHKDFNVLTDDPTEQKREDYSLMNSDDQAADDFENLPVGPITFIPATNPTNVEGNSQESTERFLVRSFGRWCALRVENANGSCEVNVSGIESVPAVNTNRTAA